MTRLFDVDVKDRWRGTREICLFVGPRTCTRCGFGELILFPTFTEDALFRFGGYGESIRRTIGVCKACGKSSEIRRESVRPPRGTP